jgi:hypothetical protein
MTARSCLLRGVRLVPHPNPMSGCSILGSVRSDKNDAAPPAAKVDRLGFGSFGQKPQLLFTSDRLKQQLPFKSGWLGFGSFGQKSQLRSRRIG